MIAGNIVSSIASNIDPGPICTALNFNSILFTSMRYTSSALFMFCYDILIFQCFPYLVIEMNKNLSPNLVGLKIRFTIKAMGLQQFKHGTALC